MITVSPCKHSAFGVESNRVRPATGDLRDEYTFQCLYERRFDFVDPVVVAKLAVFATSKRVQFPVLRYDSRVEASTTNLAGPFADQSFDEAR